MNPELAVVKAEAEVLIKAQGINQTWGSRHVLQNIDIAICENEIVTIIGPNGCGKSSLLRILLGLHTPDSGKVTRRKGLRIGYMPQNLRIDDRLPLSVSGFLMLAPGARKARVQEAFIDHCISKAACAAIIRWRVAARFISPCVVNRTAFISAR
jgi:zinc transport system ATP-binding protein